MGSRCEPALPVEPFRAANRLPSVLLAGRVTKKDAEALVMTPLAGITG